MHWFGLLLIFMTVFDGPLSAQSLDTMRFEMGDIRYMVFQRDRNGAATGPISYFGADGVLRRRSETRNGKPEGVWTYYYPNGGLWSEVPFKDGMMHGVVRTFHANGAVQVVKPYKRGKLNGERVITDPDGALVNGDYTELLPVDSAQVVYTCVNGRPHGRIVLMRRDRKMMEWNCVNGLVEGALVTYDAEGRVIRRDYYENGRFKRSEHHSPVVVNE